MKMLTNNNPGTVRWWIEYYIYKTTGKCLHIRIRDGRIQNNWVDGDEDCKLAWDFEYDCVRRPDAWIEEDA